MNIIWIIEDTTSPHSKNMAATLIGDFAVRLFSSLESLKKVIQFTKPENHPDIIIFDVDSIHGLGEQDNLNILKSQQFIHANFPQCQVLLCSQNSLEKSRHRNFYFYRHEEGQHCFDLLRTIHAITKNTNVENDIRFAHATLNIDHLKLSFDGQSEVYDLTRREALLLKALFEHQNQCMTRDDLAEKVWLDVTVSERTIDSYVSKLRSKLKSTSLTIESVYGAGYQINLSDKM